jgi:hypothetical protein
MKVPLSVMSIGETAQLTFLHVEHRLAEPVADVLECRVARIAGNREYTLECGMQAAFRAGFFGRVGLQEAAIGIELDGQQIRHIQNSRLLAEILANALFLSEGVSHRLNPLATGKSRARCDAAGA